MAEGKYDVSEIFDSIDLKYYNISDESETISFGLEDMAEMMMLIDTRPTYPSSKLTFSIANITKNKTTRFFNIYLSLNGNLDFNVVLEDSKRNFLNSFIFPFFLFN